MSDSAGPAGAQGDGGNDATFAEVLNGFTLDSGRRRRKRKYESADGEPGGQDVEAELDTPDREEEQDRTAGRPPEEPDAATGSGSPPGLFYAVAVAEQNHPANRLEDVDDAAAMVRPYQWTGGRTKATVHLELETLVSTSEAGRDEDALRTLEHRTVATLCRHPHAVAEVAAKLSVPLGVARVLLSDMAGQGLITVHQTVADEDSAAHLMLMERVLSGLRRL